jgi:hypothetical protein
MKEVSPNRAKFLAFLNQMQQGAVQSYSGEYVCFIEGLRVSVSGQDARTKTVLLTNNDIKRIGAALANIQQIQELFAAVQSTLYGFDEISKAELMLSEKITAEYSRFLQDLVNEAMKRREAVLKAREAAYHG